MSTPRNGVIIRKMMPNRQNLRIAVLIKRFVSTGGAERYAMEVTRRLALQHEVHVFAQEWSFQGDQKIIFHRIPRLLAKPSWLNQILFSHFSRRAVGDSFDIVHSHEKVTKFDVMTVHSPCFRSFITHEKRAWKRVLMWLSVPFSPRKSGWLLLEKKQFSHHPAKLFLPVSENVKRDVQTNYSLPDDCFRIAYPGVDSKMKRGIDDTGMAASAVRSKLGISEDELVFLFVGTEFKRKGLDALLRALTLIPHSKVKLVVAGGGGGKMKKYRNLAEDLGLGNHVVFLGLVKNVEELYAISDAFILPTLSDPSPMAPIEAMTFGLPTVMSCSEYSGAAEHIKSGEALILNNPHDPNEIAGALRKVMDAGFRAQLGRKGQALAAGLTWEATAANTLSVYEEVLRRKSAMHRG